MSRLLAGVIYRWRFLLSGLIVLGALALAPRANITEIDNDVTAWFSKADPVYQDYERFRAEFGGNVEAGEARHLDVGEEHIGPRTERQGNSVRARGGLADDFDVVLDVEQRGECTEDHRLILGDHDADHDATS